MLAAISTITSCSSSRSRSRLTNSIGMMAAAKPSASRRGTPESLSTSGSMPDTPHSPPATSEVGRSKPAPVATTAYPAPMALENVTCVRKSATARVERVL